MKIASDLGTYIFGLIALTLVLSNGKQVSGIIKASSDFGGALTGTLLGGK